MPRPRSPLRNVVVVLVSPANAGNVGAVARAVKNMGLGGIAIVEPRPDRDLVREEEAQRLAAGSGDVLRRIRVHPTLDAAVGPGSYLVATTARANRGLALHPPREAAGRLIAMARERPVALLFGREDHGLPNRLLLRAHEGLRIPASSRHPVLNLAQAVMVVAYELLQAASDDRPATATATATAPAPTPAALDALAQDIRDALTAIDYLKPHNHKQVLARLSRLLAGARPDAREVSMLRGVCRQIRWLRKQVP